MQTRGAIYHHKDMIFYNGGVSNKYLILLNTPNKNEPYLFVKTTSQKKFRPDNQECIKREKCFFIQAGTSFFPKPTWVLLHEIYPMGAADIDNNKDVKLLRDELIHDLIEKIVDCLFKVSGQDLSGKFKKLLRPSIVEGLLKLQDHFNQKK